MGWINAAFKVIGVAGKLIKGAAKGIGAKIKKNRALKKLGRAQAAAAAADAQGVGAQSSIKDALNKFGVPLSEEQAAALGVGGGAPPAAAAGKSFLDSIPMWVKIAVPSAIGILIALFLIFKKK